MISVLILCALCVILSFLIILACQRKVCKGIPEAEGAHQPSEKPCYVPQDPGSCFTSLQWLYTILWSVENVCTSCALLYLLAYNVDSMVLFCTSTHVTGSSKNGTLCNYLINEIIMFKDIQTFTNDYGSE